MTPSSAHVTATNIHRMDRARPVFMKDIKRMDGELPYYMAKTNPNREASNEIGAKPAWKPGDEANAGNFWDAFMQGRNFKKTYDAEVQAERRARLLAEAEAAEEEDVES